MDKTPEISVVLPVYNGGDYLSESIQSILEQSYTDFELLILDDGSTDNSLQLMRGFEQKDSRIRIYSRENRGLVPTLNELIQMARGTWIARMDADDVADSARLQRQLDWLRQTGTDVCGSWVQRFGSGDQRLVRLYQSDQAIKTELLFYSPFAHPSVMFRASLAKMLPYDETWIKAEDYDLWVRAAAAGWKMSNIPEALLLYRVHEGQISVQDAEFQQQQGHKIRRRYWHYFFSSLGLDESEIDSGLEIFYLPAGRVDMNRVDSLFSNLLSVSNAEARAVILPQLARLYRLVAADSPGIVRRWFRMHQKFGVGGGLKTGLMLALFRLLRIRQDSRLFRWFHTLHKWRITR